MLDKTLGNNQKCPTNQTLLPTSLSYLSDCNQTTAQHELKNKHEAANHRCGTDRWNRRASAYMKINDSFEILTKQRSTHSYYFLLFFFYYGGNASRLVDLMLNKYMTTVQLQKSQCMGTKGHTQKSVCFHAVSSGNVLLHHHQ